jgi:hypothetical protein
MFSVVSAFLKPYIGWIVGAGIALVLAAFGGLWLNLTLTQSALADARGDLKVAGLTIKAQERAIEAVDRVEDYRRDMNRILNRLSAQTMEAEGANEQVPPAVAHVWANGIDSLRPSAGEQRVA